MYLKTIGPLCVVELDTIQKYVYIHYDSFSSNALCTVLLRNPFHPDFPGTVLALWILQMSQRPDKFRQGCQMPRFSPTSHKIHF
jgi:hypothetical protein